MQMRHSEESFFKFFFTLSLWLAMAGLVCIWLPMVPAWLFGIIDMMEPGQ